MPRPTRLPTRSLLRALRDDPYAGFEHDPRYGPVDRIVIRLRRRHQRIKADERSRVHARWVTGLAGVAAFACLVALRLIGQEVFLTRPQLAIVFFAPVPLYVIALVAWTWWSALGRH